MINGSTSIEALCKTAGRAVRNLAEERAGFDRLNSLAGEHINEIMFKVGEAEKRLENNIHCLKDKLAEFFRALSIGLPEPQKSMSF